MMINSEGHELHLGSTFGESTANESSHERLPNERSDSHHRSYPGSRCNSPIEGHNNVLSKFTRRRSTGSPFETIREVNILGSAGDRDQETFCSLNEEPINLGSRSETKVIRGSVPAMPVPACSVPCLNCRVSFWLHLSRLLFFIVIVSFVGYTISNLCDKYLLGSTANEDYGRLQKEIYTIKRSVEDLNSGFRSDESISKQMHMDIQFLAELLPTLSEYMKTRLESEAKFSPRSMNNEEVKLEEYKQPSKSESLAEYNKCCTDSSCCDRFSCCAKKDTKAP